MRTMRFGQELTAVIIGFLVAATASVAVVVSFDATSHALRLAEITYWGGWIMVALGWYYKAPLVRNLGRQYGRLTH